MIKKRENEKEQNKRYNEIKDMGYIFLLLKKKLK